MSRVKRSAPKQGDPLPVALDAIRTGRLAAALPPLLEAWRAQPSERLADAIAMVSVRTRVEAPKLRGKTAAAIAAWTALAKRATLVDRPALLESLADAPSGEAIKRLAFVAKWMPDPRVDDAILGLIESVPYRATSTQVFWTKLFPLAERITDPRQLARLDRAEAAGVAATMGRWLRARYAKLFVVLVPLLDSSPGEDGPILDDITALLGPRKLSMGSLNVHALLQAVYDAPDDDAPRLVYADALLERNDPRGELITIQHTLARADDRDLRKREKELLEAHGKQWLGELAPIVMAGYRFERGFLAECRVENRHLDRVRKLVGNPAWSTVRVLAGSAAIALHPVMRGLRSLAFVSYEARNHEDLPDSWRDLLLETERPLEALRYSGIESDRHWQDALENNDSVRPGVQGRWRYVPATQELGALCSCVALPKLRELVVVEDPGLVAAQLLAAPITRRLDTLGFVFDSRNEREPLRWFADALRDAPVAKLVFEFNPSFYPTTMQLERGARGYERMTMEVGPLSRSNWSEALVNEAIRILDALPSTMREVRIATRRQTEPTQVARLRTAAAQMKLDVCEVG